ncbi:MAG: hypothetical protein PUG60_07200 [Lachnospiraceae bacterium]|nr:hypothetical protein [Lachnospiraceae bacterium]MDY4970462.1 hypothetical protein [Lachnospiraceae bacterium]
MANSLFDKIMGKVPAAEENPAEEAAGPAEEKKAESVKEEREELSEEETAEPEAEETAEPTAEEIAESTAEEPAEPMEEEHEEASEENLQVPHRDVSEILNSMLGTAGKTKVAEKPAPAEKTAPAGKREAEAGPSQVILIDLILDNTISMKIYYKVLYNKLFDLINGIHKAAKKAGGNVKIRYGITYIRAGEPIAETDFSDDGFTDNVLEIMEKLKNITFSGGADNGRENINGAVRMSLEKLRTADTGNTRCGILLFTDSMPEEEDMAPDFRDLADLRFARCFVNDDRDYLPEFRTVDHDGKTDPRLVNDTKINTLEYFLNEDAERMIPEVISEILEQVSVSVR